MSTHAANTRPGKRAIPLKDIPERLVIASRQSRLAMWQARFVQAALVRLYPSCRVEILGLTTQGDRILDVTLSKVGGKGLFVKELEAAIAEGRADIAVHSAKDVPMALPDGFCIAAILEREDPRDCLVSGRFESLESLPAGARVGTSSLRREVQLRRRFPALEIASVRGNVDTRLAKLDRGEYDALLLAAAGLKRLELGARIRALVAPEDSLPAPGQGALAIECRSDRADLAALLAPLVHDDTSVCVRAERALSRALSGSCQLPLGAYATLDGGRLRLRAFISTPDAQRLLATDLIGDRDHAEALGERAAQDLRARGADEVLAALE